MESHHRTRIFRCTLAQEARVFLGPAPFWRKVQLVLPASPKIFVGLDVLPSIIGVNGGLRQKAVDRIIARASDGPAKAERVAKDVKRGAIQPPSLDGLSLDQALEAIGWNRAYKMPEMTSGAPVRFKLAPGQWITGMSGEGIGTVAVVAEWNAGPR